MNHDYYYIMHPQHVYVAEVLTAAAVYHVIVVYMCAIANFLKNVFKMMYLGDMQECLFFSVAAWNNYENL